MRTSRLLLWMSAASTIGVATSVLASQPKPALDCSSGASTQAEMNECAVRAARAASAKLDRLVKELEPKLEADAKATFRKLQSEWLAQRDRDCEWERAAFSGGGSVGPLVYSACLEARTKERIDRLKVLLCEGGGMTAPCGASRKY